MLCEQESLTSALTPSLKSTGKNVGAEGEISYVNEAAEDDPGLVEAGSSSVRLERSEVKWKSGATCNLLMSEAYHGDLCLPPSRRYSLLYATVRATDVSFTTPSFSRLAHAAVSNWGDRAKAEHRGHVIGVS